jgi:hypothetical protein
MGKREFVIATLAAAVSLGAVYLTNSKAYAVVDSTYGAFILDRQSGRVWFCPAGTESGGCVQKR